MALVSDGSVHHFAGVRMRITGSGDLRMKFQSLDEIKEYVMVPLPMQVATNVEPFKGGNFKQQRASLHLRTTGIGEYFKISQIVVFAKVSATGLPGSAL